MATIASTNSNVTFTPPAKSVGQVANWDLTLPNTEYTITFPAFTKSFEVKARQGYPAKISYAPGTSGTVYRTLNAGSTYSEENITAGSVTLYAQSPYASVTLEVTSWA